MKKKTNAMNASTTSTSGPRSIRRSAERTEGTQAVIATSSIHRSGDRTHYRSPLPAETSAARTLPGPPRRRHCTWRVNSPGRGGVPARRDGLDQARASVASATSAGADGCHRRVLMADDLPDPPARCLLRRFPAGRDHEEAENERGM